MHKQNSKIYAFDIDGVICITLNGNYSKSIPNKNAIEKINELYSNGNKVIIYTARYMGRTKNNFEEAKKLGYQNTLQQLKSWGVKFHELYMGKPSYDILVDDKAFNYNKTWIEKL